MVIILTCSCGKHLQIGEDHARQRGLCPVCANYLTIPTAAEASPVALEPGEIALPLLLAVPEKLAAHEPGLASEPPVEAFADLKEPELACGTSAGPEISLGLGTELAGLAALGEPVTSPAAVLESPAETVLVPPLTVTALTPTDEELHFGGIQDVTRPRYGVFSCWSVFWATLVGGIVSGALILAYNYQTVRRRWAMRLTGAVGIASFLVFLVLISVWPQIHAMSWLRLSLFALMAPLWVVFSPSFPVAEKCAGLAPALLMLGAAWFLQRNAYHDHLRRGGQPASVWSALGSSLFCAVITFTGIGIHLSLFPEERQGRVKVQVFDPGGLRQVRAYYQPGVDEEDVRRVGKFLVAHKPSRITTVYLTPRDNGLIVSFVLREAYWDDPLLRQNILDLTPELSETLDGRAVRVEFCNEELTRRRQIR